MPDLVSLACDGGVALITIDNPPVNALSAAVRAGLIARLAEAAADAGVAAIVIRCAGRTFVAGADITEFGKAPQPPILPEVFAAIEASRKPVIAALHGTPLGGGLELALACHGRIASAATRTGLPEIKLGLIPGSGGTQRLPRLIGMEKALAMILTGAQIGATEALDIGLLDALTSGDLTAEAVAFARKAAADGQLPVLARDRDDRIASMRADPAAFAALAAPYLKRARGQTAPAAAVEALRGALDLPFEEGLARERASFLALRDGPQSKALRHVFFAEREAAKIPDLPAGARPREVVRAAVIGAGTMGAGIAICCAGAGLAATLVETAPEALARGLDTVAAHFRALAARGTMPAEEAERRIGLVAGSTDMAAIGSADVVIEAVFEDMEVKTAVFAALDRLAAPGAVLATNTSYLDVDALAQATRRPGLVVGLHFFSPAPVMRLLEVVRARETAPETLATAIAVGRKLGKVPVVVGVCHGFVGNRMMRLRSIECERLLVEGALPYEVDAAMTSFGFAMGPFAVMDLAGLDISWRMRKAQGATAAVGDALCEMGRFGQKTGKGFYLYEAGSRSPRRDAEVERLIVETSARLGVTRRALAADEIVERLLFPMINEGARILDEGIARHPGDIDVVWINGYGFPAWRGGPMHYADTVGLAHVRDRLEAFAAAVGDERHKPAPLLARLAAAGRGFGE